MTRKLTWAAGAALAGVLVVAALAWYAHGPSSGTLTVPEKVTVRPGELIVVRAQAPGGVAWYSPDGLTAFPADLLKDGHSFVAVAPLKAGSYRVVAFGASGSRASGPAACLVVVGDAPPVPPGPPNPPSPVMRGLKVLVLYESGEEGKMPKSQQAILHAPEIRDWLNAHCDASKETMSGTAWAIWDKDVDASAMSKGWQDVLKRPHPSMPWIVVFSDAGVAFEGPLPADVAATVTLLSKYAPSSRRKAG